MPLPHGQNLIPEIRGWSFIGDPATSAAPKCLTNLRRPASAVGVPGAPPPPRPAGVTQPVAALGRLLGQPTRLGPRRPRVTAMGRAELLVAILILVTLMVIGVATWSIERRSAAAARRAAELAKADSQLRQLESVLVVLLEMQALFLNQLGPNFPRGPTSPGTMERKRLQRALTAELQGADPLRNRRPTAAALADTKDVLKWAEEDLRQSIAQVLFLLRAVVDRH